MKKLYFFIVIIFFTGYTQAQVPGIATVLSDTICVGTGTELSLTGYTGTILWQSNNGSGWVNETNSGFNTDSYLVFPTVNTDYRAEVSNASGNSAYSNTVTVVIQVVAPPVASGVSRCGYGSVTLNASGTGDLTWFDAPVGGNTLAQGSSFTTNVSQTDTFYVSASVNGGSGNESPILITELDMFSVDDYLEIQNVSSFPIDVTGWKIAVSDDYSDINQVNSIVQVLSGTLNPGDIISYSDGSAAPNYWGNNIFWNPGSNGWAMILDNNNNIVDVAVADWLATEMTNFAPVISGTTVFPTSEWNGDGFNYGSSNLAMVRIGGSDNDNAGDFSTATQSPNTTNLNLSLPFAGFGCSSSRVEVIATVTPAPAIAVSANPSALCAGSTSQLSVSSTNPSYNYTWSPAGAWLSSTTGSSVIASPPVDVTYVVVADDGTCGTIDSVSIEVGTPTAGGTASASQDTICNGSTSLLSLTGSIGNIQWQSNNGLGWNNETGNGNNSPSYLITPTQLTQYRAILTSGGCPADTSTSIFITTVNPASPIVSDTARCGPGVVSLSATANGNLFWFTSPAGGNPIATGNFYAPNIFSTLTYYVENRVGPPRLNVGPVQNNIGAVGSQDPNNTGIRFDVFQYCTLENVYVFPDSAGTVVINLRDTQGGPILATASKVVVPGGKTVIPLNFSLIPGLNYRLEVDPSSPDLRLNTSGATFPYSNQLISLNASLNPGVTTFSFQFLYDWEVSSGCKSARVPVTGTILPIPPTPLITVNGTQLSSSVSNGNQWYQDGNAVAGATGQTYTVTANGNYFVSVTQNGCTSYSDTIFASSVSELPKAFSHFFVAPNPGNGLLQIDAGLNGRERLSIALSDALGRIIQVEDLGFHDTRLLTTLDLRHLQAGIYLISLQSGPSRASLRIIIN